MLRRGAIGAAIATVAIALTGCGDSGSSDEQTAKQPVEDFGVALVRGDGEAACAQLTSKAQTSIRDLINKVIAKAGKPGAQRGDCASAVTALVGSRNIEPGAVEGIRNAVDAMNVSVQGNTATGTVTAETKTLTVPLVRVEGKWLISDPNQLLFGGATR
jgi:hypothetical protein